MTAYPAKQHPCSDCPNMFIRTSGHQTRCPDCQKRHLAKVALEAYYRKKNKVEFGLLSFEEAAMLGSNCKPCEHLEYCRRMVRTQAPLHRKCEPNQPKSRRVIAELARTPASYRIPEMIVADGCMSVEHTVSAKSTVVTRESAQVEAR